ncbi:MAG: hypothetical protein ABMA64_23495 [Myxococcota bacterium]
MRFGWLAFAFAACTGGEEEVCEDFQVVVSVVDPAGGIVVDALVEINNTPCTAVGDGTYECVGHFSDNQHNIAATHPMFNAKATFVNPPEGCDQPVEIELQLGVMMGS